MKTTSFLGTLVLDIDNTRIEDKSKIVEFINLMSLAWNNTKLVDLFNVELIDTILTTDNITNGFTIINSTAEPLYNEIPSKCGSLFYWSSGTPIFIESYETTILQKYLKINENNKEYPNFSKRIKHNVVDSVSGVWSGVLINSSKRSNIIILTKNKNLYFSIVYLFNCTLLIWSTQFDVINLLLDSIPDSVEQAIFKTTVWINHITPFNNNLLHISKDNDKSVLVLHPLYLITRYKKWSNIYNNNPLILFNLVGNYLERITI